MVRCICSVALATMLSSPNGAFAQTLKPLTVKVDGKPREALIHLPDSAQKTPAPVILVFHGHGETMKIAADDFACHQHWPAAICVYLQGLPTVAKSDPKGERSGWQNAEKTQGDRDLKLFDEVLAYLKKRHKVDDKQIFATGFSNGGNFTFLLWAERSDVLAAVAPCAGVSQNLKNLKPKPCLLIVGKKDGRHEKLDQVVESLCKVNSCVPEGKRWTKDTKLASLLYASKSGTPLVSAVHPGGHEVPDQAGRLIVRFFKENGRK